MDNQTKQRAEQLNENLKALIAKAEAYEKWVKENIPFDLWHKFSIWTFKGNGKEDQLLSINGAFVPSDPDDFGMGKYWYGDFNYYYDAVSIEEFVEFMEDLPSYIAQGRMIINDLSKRAKAIADNIDLS